MIDRMLNPSPTIYKWDRFWVGFLPALVLPAISMFVLYGIMALSSHYVHHEEFAFSAFTDAMHSNLYFLRITTLCCMPNAALFFLFIRLNYNNASRAVVVTTIIYVLVIVIKDMS